MKRLKHLSFPPDRLLKFIFICMAIMILVLQPGCHTGSSNPNTPGFQGVQPPDYWPTDGWRSTTPEQQGMDSGRLADMLETIAGQNYPIRSVLVIRSGYLVTGAYFHPFEEGFLHIIHSCTKSITSALIGIAIDKGFIQHENTGVLEFFPDYNVANLTGAGNHRQIQHILSPITTVYHVIQSDPIVKVRVPRIQSRRHHQALPTG
ncbi:MAG: hypothetical protein GY940_40200, partial [bacterium]|nr:hypothetical protein [bacterium]